MSSKSEKVTSENWEKEVRERELDDLLGRFDPSHEEQDQRENLSKNLTGLALSGGGIRSAAFSLGVFQAMLRFDVATKFHYLSTVSGGGYLGVAVNWLRQRFPDSWRSHFFSSGTRNTPGIWLDFIRQHVNYLQPPRIGVISLIGVAVRNLLLSVGVYLALLALLFIVLHKVGFYGLEGESIAKSCNITSFKYIQPVVCYDAASVTGSIFMLLVLVFIMYSLGSFVVSFDGKSEILASSMITALLALPVFIGIRSDLGQWCPTCSPLPDRWRSALLVPGAMLLIISLYFTTSRIARFIRQGGLPESGDPDLYSLRVRMQTWGGLLLAMALILGVAAALPKLAQRAEGLMPFSLAAVFIGVATTYRAFGTGKSLIPKSILSKIRIVATFVVVTLAGAISAYVMAKRMNDLPDQTLIIIAVATLAVAFCTNLNQFGIGRMYRDRLMEAFMPDEDSISTTSWKQATKANESVGRLTDLWKKKDSIGSLYPLINTNVVLVDSRQDTYRGRGGDSFVLSPRYCGSDATGWVATENFADGDLKAGTAMAISGAAANPNAAPGGRGFGRNRLVSFLMFVAQARLGAWVVNPLHTPRIGWQRAKAALLGQRPNFLFPGIRSGLFGLGLHENGYFLELTDGGHFDNTGVYELIRRRVKLIVLAQAGQDKDFGLGDLANLAEKIRVDFNARLYFGDGLSLQGILPKNGVGRTPMATRGHAVARIDYDDGSTGWFVYLQATPIRDLPVDVHSYHYHNSDFPNEPTANQFFREAQLEAYRQLGYTVAKRFLLDVTFAHESTSGCYCGLEDDPEHETAKNCLCEIYKILEPNPPNTVRGANGRRRHTPTSHGWC
jgi:hypothetical protein